MKQKSRKPLSSDLYCPNPACSLFGQVEGRKLERHAYYGAHRTTIYLCRSCAKTFSDTKGTFFYRLHTDRQKVLDVLAIVAEQGGIRATARATGVDKDTVQAWVEKAGAHVEEVSAYLIRERHLSEAQLDELWTFVKKKTSNFKQETLQKKSGTSLSGAV